MPKSRKAINFDLDTNQLKRYYSETSYPNAYNDIRQFLNNNGFVHRQGSGYLSKKPMTTFEINQVIENMNDEYQWLKYCVKEMDVTNISSRHSVLDIFERSRDLESEINILQDEQESYDIQQADMDLEEDLDEIEM
ncbi:hypothetical protein MKC55_24415 [[Clostridium] innocuum]|nr:hypothetical protein [[Clostridium] innocuum]